MEHFPTLVVTILCTGIIAAGNENPPSLAEVSKANNLFAKDLYQVRTLIIPHGLTQHMLCFV